MRVGSDITGEGTHDAELSTPTGDRGLFGGGSGCFVQRERQGQPPGVKNDSRDTAAGFVIDINDNDDDKPISWTTRD
jgi:hypothetical protein